jgi:hypothetical protein
VESGPPPSVEPQSGRLTDVQARLVRVLMGLIMFVTGTYVGVDWAGFYYHFDSPYSARAGYARTLLCAILVWMIGGAAVDGKDARQLNAAFALALVADYCLILHDWMIPGTVIFLAVHGLLIARHARGFSASWSPEERPRTLRLLAITAFVVYAGALGLIHEVRPILERTGMFALDAIYLLLLSTSLWMAWGTLIRRFYGRRNAWFIVIGMTCFFFCDVTVGLAAALKGTTDGKVLNNIVGFFYSPALVLLAYSGYQWYASPAPVPAPADS